MSERTGQRRYVEVHMPAGSLLALQVEKTEWVKGDRFVLGRWRTSWHWAQPSDISSETVIGLSDT